MSIHDLRHLHASLFVYLGENPQMIQASSGHKNVEMTLGTYGHLYPNERVAIVRKLDKLNTSKYI